MKKRILHSLFACLCVSVLTSCGAQQALHFAQQTALDTSANTIMVDGKPIFKVSSSVLNLKEVQHQSSMPPFLPYGYRLSTKENRTT